MEKFCGQQVLTCLCVGWELFLFTTSLPFGKLQLVMLLMLAFSLINTSSDYGLDGREFRLDQLLEMQLHSS